MTQLPLFAFGTLRRGECNHHYLAGKYLRVQAARLPGFVRVAPLMIARDAVAHVEGELFYFASDSYAATLKACDELEEIPRGFLVGREYRRIAVRVEVQSETAIAWAYTQPAAEPDADLLQIVETELRRLRTEIV